jgi:hypothetical protein
MILDLLSLNVHAPLTAEKVSTVADNLAMAAAEKKNPMACQLLM